MGFDYYIACKNCQKFVDMGEWRLFSVQFPKASKTLFKDAGNVAAVSIGAAQLQERLQSLDDSFSLHYRDTHDFQILAGILKKFQAEHANHDLLFVNSSGDQPWAACDRYAWYEWKEVIGPNSNLAHIDLPKNLIDDLHLSSWEQVEKHLLGSPRYNPKHFPGDIELVKDAFKKLGLKFLTSGDSQVP